MSVNCSATNASLPSAPFPAHLLFTYMHQCLKTTLGSYVVGTFTATSIVFLLPVYVFILRLGFKQWRQQGFSTMAMSHFDLFTYHMVLLELFNVMACSCVCCGMHANNDNLLWTGIILSSVGLSGQLYFHTLTCAERHLAVVHPVTYLSLKGEKWNRARNVLIASIWLLTILTTAITFLLESREGYSFLYLIAVLELFLILVFSLSVLRELIRSGPGEGNGGRWHMDQAKLRAFYLIVSVLVVVAVRLIWNLLSAHFVAVPNQKNSSNCRLMLFTYWIGLPCSLIIPLLYLQKKWRLFKKKREPKHPKG